MVMLTDQAESLVAQLRLERAVVRATTLPGYERLGAIGAQSIKLPVDLATTDAEKHRCTFNR